MAGELNPASSIVSWSNKPETTPTTTTTTTPTTAVDDKQTLPTIGQKRQRRPSVRLGDIKPLVTAHHPRPKPFPNSRTRPLTNLDSHSKRPLTNFSRVQYSADDDDDNGQETNQNSNFNHQEEDDEDEHQQQQQQRSPVTDEDEGVWQHRRPGRGNFGSSGGFRGLDDGVRKWLIELGLSRYGPLFEIHEVDDDVLPHLTLDDLKDMGITAVGSRRKLHTAILNIRKNS